MQPDLRTVQNTTWPLGDTATVRLTPFVTGDEEKTEWGNVIRKVAFHSGLFSANIARNHNTVPWHSTFTENSFSPVDRFRVANNVNLKFSNQN